jgi:hypothetical protein
MLYGEKGAIEIADKSTLKVNMNISDSRVVRVPLLFEVPVEVPLSSLNLAKVIEELQEASVQMHTKAAAGSQSAGGDAR